MKIVNKKVKDVVLQAIKDIHKFEIIFEDDTKTSINWKDGQYGIDNIACDMLNKTLNRWGQKKNNIANEYAINGRQVIVFLNEMIGLNRYIAHEKNWQKYITDDHRWPYFATHS